MYLHLGVVHQCNGEHKLYSLEPQSVRRDLSPTFNDNFVFLQIMYTQLNKDLDLKNKQKNLIRRLAQSKTIIHI